MAASAQAGVLAEGPGGRALYVPVAAEVMVCCLGEVASRMRGLLAAAFGMEVADEEKDDVDFRVLYRQRDLDDASSAADLRKALVAGQLCAVKVMFRLLGGKGGFGALLKKQMSRGKKTTNVDACRDLTGRRIRHSKAVERIKEWMEKKKIDDELVAALTAEGPELPAPTPAHESLDPEYLRKLKHASADRPAVVKDGMRLLDAGAPEPTKRARVATSSSSAAAAAAEESGAIGLQDALGMLSGSSPEYEDEEPAAAAAAGGSSSSSGAASAAAASSSAAAASSSSSSAAAAPEVRLRAPQSTARVFAKDPAKAQPSSSSASASTTQASGSDAAASSAAPAAAAAAAAPSAPKPARGVTKPTEEGAALSVAEVKKFASKEELASKVDADTLKRSLMAFGLKCGGTPVQKAERLLLLKDKAVAELPKSVLAPKPAAGAS